MKLFVEILKKNILLVITMVVSLVVSLVLLFFALGKSSKIREYQATLDSNIKKLQEKIQGVSPSNPGPVKQNIDSIKDDITKITKKVNEINLLFGNPYRKAWIAFATALGEDEFNLLMKWRETFRNEIRRNNLPKQIFVAELAKYDPEKVKEAKNAFKETLAKETVEPLEEINDYILDAIGIPRQMTPEDCKRYISTMNEGLQQILKSKDIGKGVLINTNPSVSFIIYDKLPLPAHIPFIVKNYKALEDMVIRMKNAGITDITMLTRTTPLDGVLDKNFLYLGYKITINGPLNSIREFCNNLINAHKDNRVYIIKNMKLEKITDEVSRLNISQLSSLTGKESKVSASIEQQASASSETTKGILLGGTSSNMVKADIELDYVIYIGDEIRK